MIDTCPNCGARRGELTTPFVCYHDWHAPKKPELMFSFRLPGSGATSEIVSETEINCSITAARHLGTRVRQDYILASAAERMIEMTKAPAPDHVKVKLGRSSGGVRAELEDMLLANGLHPAKYLKPNPASVHHTKEPSNVCFKPDEPNSKQIADQGARDLARMLSDDLNISITPIILRLWMIARWDDIAKHAHKIHGSAS